MPGLPQFTRLEQAPDWVRNYYRLRLDIEFRSVRGDSFQRLFDRVMYSIHASDYQATAALGKRGDLGCDGYLKSRHVLFACYGPDPYFRIDAALAKMRSDFRKALQHWRIPGEVREWVFVVNYPGQQPELIRATAELESSRPELTVRVWSRQDIMEQFLLWARRRSLVDQFGTISSQARPTGRAFLVPEGTALPRTEANLAAQMVRARLVCDRQALEENRRRWFEAVAAHPFECLTVQVQFLIGAIAAMVMAGLLDPQKLELTRLLKDSEMSRRGWRDHGKRAWSIAMAIIDTAGTEIELPPADDPIGDDLDKLIGTIVAADRLVHGLLRMYSRDSGDLETECLDDVWHYVSTIPIRDDDDDQ